MGAGFGAPAAIIGSGTSHEGLVELSLNLTVLANGIPLAVVGSPVACTDPEHESVILTGSGGVLANGIPVSRMLSVCECEAFLTPPAANGVIIGGPEV